MFARLRAMAYVGLGFLALGVLLNLLAAPDRLAARMGGFVAMAMVESLMLLLCRWPVARRCPQTVCAGFIIAIGGLLLYLIAQSPQDLDVLSGTVTCVMVSAALIYPVTAPTQAIVAGVLGVAYVGWVVPPVAMGSMRAMNLDIAVGFSGMLSVVGASVLEGSRRLAFVERRRVRALAVQRRRLIEIGRDLWSTLRVDRVLASAGAHARALVPCDGVTIHEVDADTGAMRVAVSVGDADPESLIGVEWPAASCVGFETAFGTAELREFPGTAIDPVVEPHVRAFGVRRVLIAAIGPSRPPDAFVWWSRVTDVPFTAADKLAAQGLAHQLDVALRAARLFEEAQRASELKSHFVSTMSHELRTPLNVILGYNQILREEAAGDPEREQMLSAVHRASLELLDLVEATLDLGRLESGRERVQAEEIALPPLFAELAGELAPVPHAAGVTLTWDPGDVGAIVVDRRKLKTILKNLAGNALKFTHRGRIEVRARCAGADVELVVRDTGIGIAPADQALVFEMFRQADSSDTRRYGGTGLGLYIVRQLVTLLGGTVSLESEPGQGTTFTVVLPQHPATVAPREQAA